MPQFNVSDEQKKSLVAWMIDWFSHNLVEKTLKSAFCVNFQGLYHCVG